MKDCCKIELLPELAKTKIISMSGLRAATDRARQAPKDCPTRYIGMSGDW